MQDLIEKTSKLSEGAMEEEEEECGEGEWHYGQRHADKSQEPDAEKQESEEDEFISDEEAEEDMVSLENDDDVEE